jgi:hypothetical protein
MALPVLRFLSSAPGRIETAWWILFVFGISMVAYGALNLLKDKRDKDQL